MFKIKLISHGYPSYVIRLTSNALVCNFEYQSTCDFQNQGVCDFQDQGECDF